MIRPYMMVRTLLSRLGDVSRANKSISEYSQTLNERGLAISAMFPTGTLVMTIAANIGRCGSSKLRRLFSR